jgi:hypothetical protein
LDFESTHPDRVVEDSNGVVEIEAL